MRSKAGRKQPNQRSPLFPSRCLRMPAVLFGAAIPRLLAPGSHDANFDPAAFDSASRKARKYCESRLGFVA